MKFDFSFMYSRILLTGTEIVIAPQVLLSENTVLCDSTPCSPVEFTGGFGWFFSSLKTKKAHSPETSVNDTRLYGENCRAIFVVDSKYRFQFRSKSSSVVL